MCACTAAFSWLPTEVIYACMHGWMVTQLYGRSKACSLAAADTLVCACLCQEREEETIRVLVQGALELPLFITLSPHPTVQVNCVQSCQSFGSGLARPRTRTLSTNDEDRMLHAAHLIIWKN